MITTTVTATDYRTNHEIELERRVGELQSILDCLLQECVTPSGILRAPSRRMVRDARACLPAGYQMTLPRRRTKSASHS